jgi:uncharacterized BrkB/YihY/UPF0761 family membrane protein
MNYSPNSISNAPLGFILLVVVAGLFWLIVLASALSRNDFDPVTKLMWIFVIVAVPVFGALLYLFIAPGRPKTSDDVSATTTCAGCHATIPADSSACPKCGRDLY